MDFTNYNVHCNYIGSYDNIDSACRYDNKAADKFQMEIAKAYLEARDHAKLSNKDIKIPADTGVKKDPTEAVKVSVDTGDDINATDADGSTALHVAAKKSQTEAVKALIEAGANFDAKDTEGDTPLHIVVKKGQTDVAQALIKAGASLNAKDDDRNTPLHITVKKGQTKIARALVEAGANLSAKDDNDDTPLHVAAKRGQAEALKVLIEAGANLNAKDDNGNTPLHIAVKRGKTDVVKALVEAGASVDIMDKNGLTPLNIAQTMENLNLIQILRAKPLAETKYITNSSKTYSDSTAIFTVLFTALGYLAKVDGMVSREEIEFVTSLMDEMKLAPERRRSAEDLFHLGMQKSDVDLGNFMIDLRNHYKSNSEVLNVFVMSLIQLAYSNKNYSDQEKISSEKQLYNSILIRLILIALRQQSVLNSDQLTPLLVYGKPIKLLESLLLSPLQMTRLGEFIVAS